MALVALSVVEQRLDAVRAVLAGASVTEVAAQVGVLASDGACVGGRYLSEGVGGSGGSVASAAVVSASGRRSRWSGRWSEMRREHPRWGAKRIRLELLRQAGWLGRRRVEVPSTATINRILLRQGLVGPRPRKRPRSSFIRFERPGPMQLWGIDIVGGIAAGQPGDRGVAGGEGRDRGR